MIIDSHVHLCEPPYNKDKLSLRIADGTVINLPFIRADISVDRLLHDMDECHIDKSLVVAFSGIASNEFVSKVVKDHPKRLVGFASVTNPRINQ